MMEHLPVILAALLAVSEALSLIPSVKSNGIVQLVIQVLKKLVKKEEPKQEEPKQIQ
jgi:hypothetical protein